MWERDPPGIWIVPSLGWQTLPQQRGSSCCLPWGLSEGEEKRKPLLAAISSFWPWWDSRERVHHGGHRRLVPGADVVEVQHALYGPGLHAPHDGFGVAAEEGGTLSWWAKTQRVHPEPTFRARQEQPHPSTPGPGRGLVPTAKGRQEAGTLRNGGRGALVSLQRGGRESKDR